MMTMEAARILWISRLRLLPPNRLISSRLTPCRCYINAPRGPNGAPRTRLLPPAAVHCSPLTSISSAAPGRCSLTNIIRGPVYTSYIQSSGVSCPPPRTLTYPGGSRSIRTTSRLNVLLPPHIWLVIKPLQKLFAIILGRSLRNWWKSLPPNKRQLFKESVRRNKWKLTVGAGVLGFVVLLFYFTNLEETPITGRSRLLVFRKEDYNLLTSVEYESLMEEFKDVLLPAEDERYRLVQRIVQHLIACNQDLPEVSRLQCTVHIVDKPEVINAYVLPNGQVFVFTGMLNAVADINQLTFILGHELAHAILEHTAEKASVSHFLDFLLLISLAMIWAICPRDSLAVVGQWIHSRLREYLFERPYSRTLEAEADKVGLQLAAKAVKLRESCDCPDLPPVDPRLVFEMSMKQMLQKHRDSENREISGAIGHHRVDDGVALTAVAKGA
ncbi:metalloendopeptidase OMA1, mitochondrial isoform 2-T3 [Leptodactylus fuscus]|uniref:metalloendopeptidase OMA1, mitochondrial isoform X2 n=1 Tax=Leptodactylus fuscus TaxID=238119 RepID=UPI003F4F1D07